MTKATGILGILATLLQTRESTGNSVSVTMSKSTCYAESFINTREEKAFPHVTGIVKKTNSSYVHGTNKVWLLTELTHASKPPLTQITYLEYQKFILACQENLHTRESHMP